ncbi:MAG: diacylglycerol kinase family lipid kinase [Clostridia bacterium]|nr:diacylglycerol kinase family lipid kinase [Clostridia bacterium]
MKHVFIINPNTVKKLREKLVSDIKQACEAEGVEWEIYYTDAPRDAEKHTRELAETKAAIRVYACGGDGTIGEVANGAYGFPNVEVAAIPGGTGNDFVRNFAPAEAFADIRRQIRGRVGEIDLIRYNDRFAANTINIGFDCAVVDYVERHRGWPLMNGSKSYTVAAFAEMIPMPKCSLKLTWEGQTVEQKLTLCSIANGRYCGGGFKSNPQALLDDGLFDVFRATEKVGRIGFLKLVGKYREGTHLEYEKMKDRLSYFQTGEMTISSDKPFKYCVDGEVEEASELKLKVVPAALRFVIPEGAAVTSL